MHQFPDDGALPLPLPGTPLVSSHGLSGPAGGASSSGGLSSSGGGGGLVGDGGRDAASSASAAAAGRTSGGGSGLAAQAAAFRAGQASGQGRGQQHPQPRPHPQFGSGDGNDYDDDGDDDEDDLDDDDDDVDDESDFAFGPDIDGSQASLRAHLGVGMAGAVTERERKLRLHREQQQQQQRAPLLDVQQGARAAGEGDGGGGGAGSGPSPVVGFAATKAARRRRKRLICCGVCSAIWVTLIVLMLLGYFVFVPQYIEQRINADAAKVRILQAVIALGANPLTNTSFVLHSQMQFPPSPVDSLILATEATVVFHGFTDEADQLCAPPGAGAGAGGVDVASLPANATCGGPGSVKDGSSGVIVGKFGFPDFHVKRGKPSTSWMNGTFAVTDLDGLTSMLRGVMRSRKMCWSARMTVSVRVPFFPIPFHGITLDLPQHTCGAANFSDAPPQVTGFNVIAGSPGVASVRMNSTVTNPTPLAISVPVLTGFIRGHGHAIARASRAPFILHPGVNVFTDVTTEFRQNDDNYKAAEQFISDFVMGRESRAVMFGNSSSTKYKIFQGLPESITVNLTVPGSPHPRIVNSAIITWDIVKYFEGRIPLELSIFNPLAVGLHIAKVNIGVYFRGTLIAMTNETFAVPPPRSSLCPSASDCSSSSPAAAAAAAVEGPTIYIPPEQNTTTPEILARIETLTVKEVEAVLGDDIHIDVDGTLTVVLGDGFETQLKYAQKNIAARFEDPFNVAAKATKSVLDVSETAPRR